MTHTMEQPMEEKVVELPTGEASTTSDYTYESCMVLAFINRRDGAGIDVFESTQDNLNPSRFDPDGPWHDPKDFIDRVEPGLEYEREIKDASGTLSRLIVRACVEQPERAS